MQNHSVPCLPDTAPFTPEQRAYLNGFLAGLFSRTPAPGAIASAELSETKPSLTILFGSQTGNAEMLAKRVAKQAVRFSAEIFDMAAYPTGRLAAEERLIVITSTYGDGDPPDNAKGLWAFLAGHATPNLARMSFSVLALGDSNYPKFCECGKQFDRRLEELGARRIFPRVDCDVEFEKTFCRWVENVLPAFDAPATANGRGSIGETSALETTVSANRVSTVLPEIQDSIARPATERASVPSAYSKHNPFPARVLRNRLLNGAGSAKETRHFEFSLEGSGLSYRAGDVLGVVPTNSPALVLEILHALGCSGAELVASRENGNGSFQQALLRDFEITRISQTFLRVMAEKTGDAQLKKLTAPNANGELTEFLWGREIIDLLLAFPQAGFTPAEFLACLRKLPPRLYSISSSPMVHRGEVHLTVAIVRYESHGRKREGVCSSFLADRAEEGSCLPVFIHENKNFRPPADGSRPMIMVGPGTGIAPFRGFLYERQASGATGPNWLFFGDQHESTDFLYREEMEVMRRNGTIERLDTAFSRDQAQKIYVQTRMIENAPELFAWLERGAHFYVCGDAKRMAKDVDAALHRVIELGGGRSPEGAAEYVTRLKAERRYQRDVY